MGFPVRQVSSGNKDYAELLKTVKAEQLLTHYIFLFRGA